MVFVWGDNLFEIIICFDFYWEIDKMILMKNETEKVYPQQSTRDKVREYSYLHTESGNSWYSVNTNPMRRDYFICPKYCWTVKIVV